jgi:hypothetical protein
VADVVARTKRLRGFDVHFLTGTDEHGQKIERAAAAQNLEPIKLADKVVEKYHALWKTLRISHDDFIRTTEERHRKGVYALFEKIRANGRDDIFLDDYEGAAVRPRRPRSGRTSSASRPTRKRSFGTSRRTLPSSSRSIAAGKFFSSSRAASGTFRSAARRCAGASPRPTPRAIRSTSGSTPSSTT